MRWSNRAAVSPQLAICVCQSAVIACIVRLQRTGRPHNFRCSRLSRAEHVMGQRLSTSTEWTDACRMMTCIVSCLLQSILWGSGSHTQGPPTCS